LFDIDFDAVAEPAIFMDGAQDIFLCKRKSKKKSHGIKKFIKKHKKAIIIGVIIVVAIAIIVTTVVISSSAAGAAVAAGLASAASAAGMPDSNNGGRGYSESNQILSSESLASSLQEQVSSFKETIAKEQFAAFSESNGISIEENGRIVGSLFAHKTIDTVMTNFSQNPFSSNELKDLGFNSHYPIPKWLQTYPENSTFALHPSTDLAFSTDYATTYAANGYDLNMLSYQTRGSLALSSECYTQAVQDFGKAISLDPNNSTLYLERGIANFELGNYENSLADYSQYIEKKGEPFSVTDFSLGFAKGVPKGVYESGKGSLLFLSEFITHPVQTSKQIVDSLSQLVTLVKNDEFGVVAEVLSPELHQLITQWETLPSETRGELAGYAVGKVGTDLLAPGAIAKITSKCVNSAKELAAICKNIQIARETLILETASGIGVPARVSEIVEMGKKTASLGEELGFTAQEMGQLQKAARLEPTITKHYDHLSLSMQESIKLFEQAGDKLKPYQGLYMAEWEIRELIHSTGIPTFTRPKGIPENYRIKLSDKPGGIKYVHPRDEGTYIRIMPGKPHSKNSSQQRPYVNQRINGKSLDKHGNLVSNKSEEAHIAIEEFIYREGGD
jgi:tetratricopeptide (TPR) repeat protein